MYEGAEGLMVSIWPGAFFLMLLVGCSLCDVDDDDDDALGFWCSQLYHFRDSRVEFMYYVWICFGSSEYFIICFFVYPG